MTMKFKALPLCAAIGLAVSQGAGAAMTSSSSMFNADQTIMLPLFDTNQGLLTGVSLMIMSDWDTELTVEYDGPEGGSGAAQDTYTVSAESSHGAEISGVPGAGGGPLDLGDLDTTCEYDDSEMDPMANVTCMNMTSAMGVLNGEVSTLFGLAALDPMDFLGGPGDTFNLMLTAASMVDLCSNPAVGTDDPDCTAETNWSGEVTVKYTFQVPEPTTLAVFGLGLAGLGVARKRRSRDRLKA